MAQKWLNPADEGGALDCLAWRLDGSEHTQNRRAMQCSVEIDELVWKLGRRLQSGHLDKWDRDFAKSILAQYKRPRWSPSARQLVVVRRLISAPVEPAGVPDEILIDEADDDAA